MELQQRFLDDLQRTHARLLRLTHAMAVSQEIFADQLDRAEPHEGDGAERVLVAARAQAAAEECREFADRLIFLSPVPAPPAAQAS